MMILLYGYVVEPQSSEVICHGARDINRKGLARRVDAAGEVVIDNPAGGYRFIPGAPAFSGEAIVGPEYAITCALFQHPISVALLQT